MPKGNPEQIRAQKARARQKNAPVIAIQKKIARLRKNGAQIPQELYDEIDRLRELIAAGVSGGQSVPIQAETGGPCTYVPDGTLAGTPAGCQGTCQALAVRSAKRGSHRQNTPYYLGVKRCPTCRVFLEILESNCPCCGGVLESGKITEKYAKRELAKSRARPGGHR